MRNKKSRRDFVKESGIALAAIPFSQTISSYNRILGSNDRVRVGVVGLHSRGGFLMRVLIGLEGTEIVALCDVDSRVLSERTAQTTERQGTTPKTYKAFRDMILNPDIDAVVIASADHTHAPFAIYAVQEGKHVYCEKPCCYNPREGELLVQAQKRYDRVVQVGNQQRSSLVSQEAIELIHGGEIGEVYEATCWYSNNRGSIGNGQNIPVPEWLDWDLWQGPAPRKDYQDNVVHYNWHWFKHWGTGEINNNGMHELDICRWALDAKTPLSANSRGGRYHYEDDWQFTDTQTATFHFEGDKTAIWEGRSCNNLQPHERGRGTLVYGSKGSIMMDRNGYWQYDLGGKKVSEVLESSRSNGTDVTGEDGLTVKHFKNWHAGITKGEALNAPVEDAYRSNLLCHLGNISQQLGRKIEVDPAKAMVKDPEAKPLWKREYEPGWEIEPMDGGE